MSAAPVGAVPEMTARWLASALPGRWPSVHPLVRALLLHLMFLEIQPFECANDQVSRILLAIELQRIGCPALPIEAAVECNRKRYLDSLRAALSLGNQAGFLRDLIHVIGDAIEIGRVMMPSIAHQRAELVEVLKTPCFLGPTTDLVCLKEWAEAILRDVVFEGIGRDEGGFIADRLVRIRVLECCRLGDRRILSAPKVRKLVLHVQDLGSRPARAA